MKKGELNALIAKILELSFSTLSELLDIEFNKYYYPDIPFTKGYKCVKCSFLTLSRENVRKHLRKTHLIKESSSRRSSNYLDNVPTLILNGFNGKNVIYFIPTIPLRENKNKEGLQLCESSLPDSPIYRPNSDSPLSNKSYEEALEDYNTRRANILSSGTNRSRGVSTKELSIFVKLTRYDVFVTDKDIPTLLKDISIEDLETRNPYYFYLFNRVFVIAEGISSLIENIPRSVLLSLKDYYLSTAAKKPLDFMPFKALEEKTRRAYYREFSKVVVYLLNLYTKDPIAKASLNYRETILPDSILPTLRELDGYKRGFEKGKFREELIDASITKLFHLLLREPFKVTTLSNNKFSNPIITFFILSSIDPITLAFKSADSTQSLLSKILYNTYLFYIGYLHYREVNNSINLSEEFNVSFPSLLSFKVNNYFTELTSLKNLFKRYNVRSITTSRPIVDIDPETVEVSGIRVNLETLRRFYNSILETLEDLVFNRLLLLEPGSSIDSVKEIDLGLIDDSLSLKDPGKSLLDTPYIDQFRYSCLKRYFNKGSNLYRFFRKSKEGEVVKEPSPDRLNEYYSRRSAFIKELLLAYYLLSSSPLRGEELTIIRFSNS